MNGEKNLGAQLPRNGPFRRFLKLLVTIDSSRSSLHRLKSALLLLGLLAGFAVLGYLLPAWLSQYF